jgi:hypothetical protein
MRQKALLALVALVTLLLVAPTSFAANLVTNGSFETGDFTGWTEGGNFEDTEVVTGPFYVYTGAQDGNFYSVLGPVGSDGTLSETLTTTPGAQYTFSFWMNSVGDNPSDFSAFWDGTIGISENNPNTGGVWQEFSFAVVGTGSDTIEFSFRDDPAYIALDNVSVSPGGSTTPEPGSLLLFGSGIVGLAGMLRRKLSF